MAGFRIIREGGGSNTNRPNDQCICPCGCGRPTVNGAAMCSTCASELCAHEND